MAKREVVVCDWCGDLTRPTKRYRVTSSDRKATVDLCEEHAAGAEEILTLGGAAPGRVRKFETRVATLEEIEESKRARRA